MVLRKFPWSAWPTLCRPLSAQTGRRKELYQTRLHQADFWKRKMVEVKAPTGDVQRSNIANMSLFDADFSNALQKPRSTWEVNLPPTGCL